jgi:lipid-binding SYLF domain-containing protein
LRRARWDARRRRKATPKCTPIFFPGRDRKELFAEISLQGATLRQDLDDNATLYGKKLENRDIVTKGVRAPKAAAKLLALLNKYSFRERKD